MKTYKQYRQDIKDRAADNQIRNSMYKSNETISIKGRHVTIKYAFTNNNNELYYFVQGSKGCYNLSEAFILDSETPDRI
jgi:hypothetical protein